MTQDISKVIDEVINTLILICLIAFPLALLLTVVLPYGEAYLVTVWALLICRFLSQ